MAIDEYAPVFRKLRAANDLSAYLAPKGDHADEEVRTEPVLRLFMERVLRFPKGRYLEQLGEADERVGDTLLPKDLTAFAQQVEARRQAVSRLLAEGRALVEEVERLVCALYDVSDDLTEQVVAHAVRRSG